MNKKISSFLLFLALITHNEAQATPPVWEQAPTLTEPSKYENNFRHYDYVEPLAPKGGTLNLTTIGRFDSFNPFIVQGQAPAPVLTRFGGLIYQTLMDQSMDEGGVSHGSIAQALRSPADHAWVEIRLNPKARWHDGMPISVEDVIWSFETLTQISPFYRSYYRDIERADITGESQIKFIFKQSGNRELPKIIGDLVILPKHWWQGKNANGVPRDISKPTLEMPLGSGPYAIEQFDIGKSVTLKRVEKAWGRDLPQNIGRYNFNRITYHFLLDQNAEWESFKKGTANDWRVENNIQRWIEAYNFPAFQQGRVKKLSFPAFSGRYQAYYLNLRREKFSDRRVRKALTLALDFETINRALYFGLYRRITSTYGDQILSQRGLPEGRELAILQEMQSHVKANSEKCEAVFGQKLRQTQEIEQMRRLNQNALCSSEGIPEEVFDRAYSWPHYQTEADARLFLSEAMALLTQAGWQLNNKRQLVNAAGQPFEIEFLLQSPALERAAFFYSHNLRRLGITTHLRSVDSAQYANRVNQFDFDIIVGLVGQSTSPGNEQMDFFGSKSANVMGTRNYAGIQNPAIDWLIEHLIQAQNRDEVIATSRALDRVLLWNYYSIPNWGPMETNIAFWNKFGMPQNQPLYSGVDLYSWWIE